MRKHPALKILVAVALAIMSARAFSSPGGLLTSPRGIYVWDGAWHAGGGAETGVTDKSYVVGLSATYNWNACEPAKGTFTFNVTNCNIAADIAWATTYGKVLAIGINAGDMVPSWVASDMNAHGSSAYFTSVFDKSTVSPYTCGTWTAYDARDPTYQADLEGLYAQIASTYGTNALITRIGIPGDGEIGELGSLAWHQGETLTCTGSGCASTCGSSGCTCASNDDVGSWLALGWTPTSYQTAVETIAGYIASQFPNQVVAPYMTSGAAPCISNSGTRTCAPGSFDGTIQPLIVGDLAMLGYPNMGAENTGATSTFYWSPIAQWMPWLWTGAQGASAAGYGASGMPGHLGLLLNACAAWDELYISDLQSAGVQAYLPYEAAMLAAGCGPTHTGRTGTY